MATRLYLAMNAVPDVSPAFNQGASPFSETNLASRQRLFREKQASGEALAVGVRHGWTVGGQQLDRQFVSDPLIAGIVFTSGVSLFKAQIAAREFATSDNSSATSAIMVFSRDGSTKQAEIRSRTTGSGTEYISNASLRNHSVFNSDLASASYTTVAGDRIVIEFGHFDAAGTSPEGQFRFGCPTGTADHGENETETTSLVPWFESSVNLIFETPAKSLIIGQAVKRASEW
jgi:hypothetical protein